MEEGNAMKGNGNKGERGRKQPTIRKLEELNLIDDFMMNQMMIHPLYGEEFSNRVLGILLQKKIGRVRVTAQRIYPGEDTDLHGIRIDASIDEEDGAIYDVEPENDRHRSSREALPRRARFYHAKIDAAALAAGMDYGDLRDVYVIFIMSYDPFGRGQIVYTFTSRCEEVPDLPYDDGRRTMYLYTRGKKGSSPEELRKLLRYMEESIPANADTEELRRINEMLEQVKRDKEVGLAYMKACELKKEWELEVREAVEAEFADMIQEKDEVIQEKDEVIQERDGVIQEKDGVIQALAAEIERLREQLRHKS